MSKIKKKKKELYKFVLVYSDDIIICSKKIWWLRWVIELLLSAVLRSNRMSVNFIKINLSYIVSKDDISYNIS